MKMKVSDLDGRALNWAVAYVISDMHRDIGNGQTEFIINDKIWVVSAQGNEADDTEFDPSGNWSHGGPYGCSADHYNPDVDVFDGPKFEHKSPLVASMRCIVFSIHEKDEIEIPDELCEVKS